MLEQQSVERRRVRLPRRVLFSLSGRTDETRVLGITGHVEVVGIRAAIEQQARDVDRVLERRPVGEARVRAIENRRPAARAAGLTRGLRPLVEDPADLFQVSADDGGVEALRGERRIPRDEALRGAIVHPVVALSVHVMIPARRLEERPHDLRRRRGRSRLGSTTGCRGGERLPVVEAVLARERMLNVAQSRLGRRLRNRASQPRTRVRIACAQRLQPALRFLLEIVDGAHETPSFNTPGVRLPQAERRPRMNTDEHGWVGVSSLAADRRRPTARCLNYTPGVQGAKKGSRTAGRTRTGRGRAALRGGSARLGCRLTRILSTVCVRVPTRVLCHLRGL